jgi:hypothetical protein
LHQILDVNNLAIAGGKQVAIGGDYWKAIKFGAVDA